MNKTLQYRIGIVAGLIVAMLLGSVTLAFANAINNPSSSSVTAPVSVANGGTGLTATGATSTVLTTNGTTPAWQKLDLAAGIYGTLPAGNGGTGITSLGSGMATFFGTPTSANFFGTLTDETGSGAVVGATLPTLAGFYSTASSTVGDGTQQGGLVTSGGATTTKTALFQQGISATEASTTYAATVNFDFLTTQTMKVEMNGAITVNLKDGKTAGLSRKLVLCQDSSGSRTPTFAASSTLIWAGHTTPTQTTTALECDVYSFITTGATGTVQVFGAVTQAF